MGSPIKIKEGEKESSHGPDKKISSSTRMIIVSISVLVFATILAVSLAFRYSSLLPLLDTRLFQSMIQVIGVLLGLTVAGLFYYLGRTNSQKHEYVNSLIRQIGIIRRETSTQNEHIKKIFEAFDKLDDAKKFLVGEQLRPVLAQMSQIRRYNESLPDKLEEIITEIITVFEDETDHIRLDIMFMIAFYIEAILFAFAAIFFSTSEAGRPTSNLLAWIFLIYSVAGVGITSYFFSEILKELQSFSNRISDKTIENARKISEMSIQA
jgi:hypothetical protein